MKVKGFDALYEDPKDNSGRLTPLPGTDAYLAFVAEKKRRDKETSLRESETSLHFTSEQVFGGTVPPRLPNQTTDTPKGTAPPTIPVQTSGILEGTVPHRIPVPPTIPVQTSGILEGTVPHRIPVPPTIPVEDGDEVQITQNFMRFDLDIFELLPTLSEGEIRIYLDFIRRSYGQSPPLNTCLITRRKLGDTAGVTSPNAQVTIIQRLEQKGLIKRISTAQGKNQSSKFRVFLPCEIFGNTSRHPKPVSFR